MHSSVVFSRTTRKSETVVPIIEETFEAGRCAQNVETAERGVEIRPGSCASAVAGRTARHTAQLAASPASRGSASDRDRHGGVRWTGAGGARHLCSLVWID